MGAPTIRTMGKGTINAIRKVWVDATSTKFAMVMPDDGCSRLAVRIGANITADGEDYFFVGDKVRYTVIIGQAGEFPRAQDLVKSGAGSSSV
ncbi:hypothetical protein IMF27_04380 [Pseudomonas sp. PCH199]|uniref:hypothetical protein n=1 Tax=unclassified Pseudomonas TaxID=196821 RepID=UPI000BD1628C|nr:MULTISPECIES: hypothetical protein [unclassified Pseudomonas]MCW8275034.1 hypothetical protein [Pseudomonas sp. PCH199]PAM84709.1 hypothetical protein CES87_04465 [Pseudomonas sp. ERMR1:02]